MTIKAFLLTIQRKRQKMNGFAGMSELVIAAGTGALLIMASGAALQSTGTLIKQSEEKTTLRQNSINGLRLMRSEVERSMHLVLNKTESISENEGHINLSDSRYSSLLSECSALAGSSVFKPMFGVKMVELNMPVLYSVSLGSDGYSIERCGAPLNPDGKYKETENLFLSRVIDHVGSIPCRQENELNEGESLSTVCEDNGSTLAQILTETNFTFTGGKTPSRSERQPALRIETDTNYKLVKFIDPTQSTEDSITQSFINKLGVGEKKITFQPLYFTAFARADKRINRFGEEGKGGSISGAFFQTITSNKVRFAVDGSGSMSACVMWGDDYGTWRIYFNPNQGWYYWNNRICALTRMEALISEMTMILNELPIDTKVGITSFSSEGKENNKEWSESKDGLVRIGDDKKRDSAIAFVNTLDDSWVVEWGGTYPWEAIQKAFDDTETDTLYIMSDGQPNKNRNGEDWSNSFDQSTADYYANENNNRNHNGEDRALIVNSTSLGLESRWLEILSEKTKGYYNQIDKENIQESS